MLLFLNFSWQRTEKGEQFAEVGRQFAREPFLIGGK